MLTGILRVIDDDAWPDEFTVDYGFTTPWVYDPVIEPMETVRTLLLHTDKPGWVTTSDPRQAKYFAELASLAWETLKRPGSREEFLRTMPPFFAHAYCTTSPLKLDTHACEVLREALKHKFPVNFAPMPILGGTTPVTPAGSAVVAVAEILGCISAATLVDPDVFCYATAISGEMDMRTTQICYATPAFVLTDAAFHQLFRYKYGIVLNVEPACLEAKYPGIQVTFMKLFRQIAFGCTVSSSLPIGLLDNGSTFPPTQTIIDPDINGALYRFGRGMEISDETLCVDLINRTELCGKEAYLQTEHTLRHFREILWDTCLFDRAYRKEGTHRPAKADARNREEADREWRRLVTAQNPPHRAAGFKAEIDRIVEAARRELSA